MKKLVELATVITLVLSLALLIVIAYDYIVPGVGIRVLAEYYLYASYNPFYLNGYTAMTPVVVSAILWDFRGLDTLFESAVFFLAIVGCMSLSRGSLLERKDVSGLGLSVIVKSVTKITGPMIIAVGASIGLHGNISHGGGFQGGSVISVVTMLVIVVFSIYFLLSRGITTSRIIVYQVLGFAGIGLTAICLFIVGLALGRFAYVFQNMAKPGAPLSMPSEIMGTLISGTVWFFNLFEMIAVAFTFTVAFILMIAFKYEPGERK